MYLICVDNNLALFLVTACDEQQVVERRGVVQDAVILEGVENISATELKQVDPTLINC